MTVTGVKRSALNVSLLVGLVLASALVGAQEKLSPTLDRIAVERRIFLGYRESNPPFSYLREAERVDGYAWQVCLNVAAILQRRLSLPALQVVPVPTTQGNRLLQVRARNVDIDCGATVDTLARQRQVAFSRPIFVGGIKVLLGDDVSVARLSELAGKRLAVVADSGMDRVVRTSMALRGLALDLREFASAEEAMRALILRRSDALVMDEVSAALLRSRFGQAANFRLLDEDLALEAQSLLLNREDAGFRAAVNEALDELWASGELQRLHDLWFLQQIPPDGLQLGLPLRPALRQVYSPSR